MALFLRPEQVLVDLAMRLGPYATAEEAEHAFDTLVLSGLLKPAVCGFRCLEPLSETALQEIVGWG